MERVNVHLPERQLRMLELMATRSGLKRSEIIRRAIDDYAAKILQPGLMMDGDIPLRQGLRPRRRSPEKVCATDSNPYTASSGLTGIVS